MGSHQGERARRTWAEKRQRYVGPVSLAPMLRGNVDIERDATILRDFLLGRLVIDECSHCWNWTGASRRGVPYGYLDGYTQILPRRIAWQLTYGRIDAAVCIMNACGNTRCINPAHARIQDRAEVTRLQAIARWASTRAPERIANRQACKRGHAWSDNARPSLCGGQRRPSFYCRACDRDAHVKQYAQAREHHREALVTDVYALVPKGLPLHIREEVQQELAVVAFTKRLSREALIEEAKRLTKLVFKQYPTMFAPPSLDQLTRDGRRLGEVIGVY